MAIGDVVQILVECCEDGENEFRDRHGAEVAITAQDMMWLVREELGGQLEHDTLWAQFQAAPRQTAPELTGALEAMVEADPGLSEKLKTLLDEYCAATRAEDVIGGSTVGEGIPEAQASEFAPRTGPPVEELDTEPLGHADEAGEGTYLYGNVRGGGQPTLGETLELASEALEGRRELEMVASDIQALFEQL